MHFIFQIDQLDNLSLIIGHWNVKVRLDEDCNIDICVQSSTEVIWIGQALFCYLVWLVKRPQARSCSWYGNLFMTVRFLGKGIWTDVME